MSNQLLNFDANGVKPATGFEPVPNDWYRVHAISSEIKPTKPQPGKPGGQYLEIEWEILEGEYKGRKLWSRLNIQNANTKTQEIAQAELSAICHATGVLRLTSSSQLHHRPIMVRAIVKQDTGYEPKNELKGYKVCEGGSVAPAVQGAAPAAPAAQASNVPAWAQTKSA